MRFHNLVIVVLIFCKATFVQADVLVLVHGYLASRSSWEQSGINAVLDSNNWKRGGLFKNSPTGTQLFEAPTKKAPNKVYVADLPSEAPVMVQSDLLSIQLDRIRQQQPDEKIIIVGHSAGGVVARMSLIRAGAENVAALITIASPHVGTTRAEQAINATNETGPIGMVKNMFGGSDYNTLKRSRGLLFDLTRPFPGNMLYWLNSQKHPEIKYVSVIRQTPFGFVGDDLVPGFSQDMNNVPALKDQSSIVLTSAQHALVKSDGEVLINILKTINAN